MGWKHIPDNEEAWQYFKEGLLHHGEPPRGMIHYADPGSWNHKEWLAARFDGSSHRKNYIYLEE